MRLSLNQFQVAVLNHLRPLEFLFVMCHLRFVSWLYAVLRNSM